MKSRSDQLHPVFAVAWTLVSAISAIYILLDNLSYAAWNGINFVMALYLFTSVAAVIGLTAGFWSIFSCRRILARAVCVSGFAVMCLTALDICGFIFGRAPELPFSSPVYFAGFSVPVLATYVVPFVCCFIEALIFIPKVDWLAHSRPV